jgi:hypothetical protein
LHIQLEEKQTITASGIVALPPLLELGHSLRLRLRLLTLRLQRGALMLLHRLC